MKSDDAFERSLESLYRAALDDAHWPAATALIEQAVGVDRNILIVSDGSDSDVHIDYTLWLNRGDSCESQGREYFKEYFPHDEAVPRIQRLPHGRLAHVPNLYSEGERKTSPVFNEGLPRFGNQNGLTTRFDGPNGQSIVWCVGTPVGHHGWQSDRLRLIERLLPHVHRSVLIRQALVAADALGAGLTDLLDNDRIGAIQLDRGGRVLEANAPASRCCAAATA